MQKLRMAKDTRESVIEFVVVNLPSNSLRNAIDMHLKCSRCYCVIAG